MTSTLSSAEQKLFVRKKELTDKLLPICEALKLSGFETATIADIMDNLQNEPELPSRFSIINNRYLVYRGDLIYDLQKSIVIEQPDEEKKMAIIFWI
jgi:hypothetical protein